MRGKVRIIHLLVLKIGGEREGMEMAPGEQSETGKPRLLEEVRGVLRRKHYSLRTEEAYVLWIKRFILHHGKRHPREMGAPEVEGFLSFLSVERGVAASTQNQALSALLFLYQEVLRVEMGRLSGVEKAKRPERLPVVFTREEAASVLSGMEGPYRLMGRLLYGAGLRLMECLRLRVKDLDFAYGQITVREGKGAKDRITMLPATLAAELQEHLALAESCTVVNSVSHGVFPFNAVSEGTFSSEKMRLERGDNEFCVATNSRVCCGFSIDS